jgi:hypothetical protein
MRSRFSKRSPSLAGPAQILLDNTLISVISKSVVELGRGERIVVVPTRPALLEPGPILDVLAIDLAVHVAVSNALRLGVKNGVQFIHQGLEARHLLRCQTRGGIVLIRDDVVIVRAFDQRNTRLLGSMTYSWSGT